MNREVEEWQLNASPLLMPFKDAPLSVEFISAEARLASYKHLRIAFLSYGPNVPTVKTKLPVAFMRSRPAMCLDDRASPS